MKKILLSTMALAAAMTAGAANWPASRAAEVQQTATQTADGTISFNGDLSVYQNGTLMGTTEKSAILLTKESNGSYTFVLKDFTIIGIKVGDATILGVEGKEENGVITLETNNAEASVEGGDLEGFVSSVNITMKATVKGNSMTADITNIDITSMEMSVSAKFESKIYPSEQVIGSFDENWEKCIPWTSAGNNKEVGTTPKGWCVSNVYVGIGNQTVAKKVDHEDNGSAVELKNGETFGQKIPAYMTLGTTWATAETAAANHADGGAFGGIDFQYRPDAIRFDYMRDNSKGAENATAVAYLWKGTWTQKDVPGNTVLGGSATKTTMTDRDRNILGKATDEGGNVTYTDDATLIASLEYSISESTDGEWQTLTVPFEYKTDDTPEKINVILSANDYFAKRTTIVGNNSLTVDNVRLVYYHSLTDLKVDGTTIANFDETNTSYSTNGKASEVKNALTYTVKGAGATVEVSADDDANTVTVTVKGADYATDPSSKTVYTINVDGVSTGINGITDNTSSNAAEAIYDLSGRQMQTMQKGLNIVRGKDGKSVKIMK